MKRKARILLVIPLAIGILSWPFVSAQESDGVGTQTASWLEVNQNPTGSWGQTVPIRDTAAVVQALAELQPTSAALPPAYAWLANQPPHNHADRARLVTALAGAGFDVTALVSELQAGQNDPAPDSGTPFSYEDDFSDPESGWPESGGSTVREYTGGEYRIMVGATGYTSWASGGPFFTDVDVDVRVRGEDVGASQAYGLLFRFQDNANFYGFLIDPEAGDYALYVREDGSWSVIAGWTVSSAVRTGENSNRLRAVCQGSQITLYANGQQLTTVTDTTFTRGKLGLLVTNSSDASGADAYFDDLMATGTDDLTRPNDPEGGWGLASGYASDSLHTALVLRALHAAGHADRSLSEAVDYLLAAQNADGGWGIAKGADSNLYVTTQVMLALIDYASLFDVQTALDDGEGYLLARQNADGGWGDGGSTSHETALAYLVLQALGASPNDPDGARTYLLMRNRSAGGGWNGRAYDTALVLLALGEADPSFNLVYLPLVFRGQ